jgi:hypothetical protein
VLAKLGDSVTTDHISPAGSIKADTPAGQYLIEHRLDPTVTAAVDDVVATAPPTAGELLVSAWEQAYALGPNPNAAYGDAVRAVEEVLCPIVLPNDKLRTLGKAVQHLRDAPSKWSFVLVDRDGQGTIEPLVAILGHPRSTLGGTALAARRWTGRLHLTDRGGSSGCRAPGRHGGAVDQQWCALATPELVRAADVLAAKTSLRLSLGQ